MMYERQSFTKKTGNDQNHNSKYLDKQALTDKNITTNGVKK